jgi:hypothetical protein
MSASTQPPGAVPSGSERDTADLAQFGYQQELKRSLGTFSSFAVAFSYISPSTGIFTLFALGLVTIGGVFIWTWPVVALGQFIIALNFAEVSSHYPSPARSSSGPSTCRAGVTPGAPAGFTCSPASSP